MISVVVPIYQVEEYLRKCIDSIVEQTYKDLEIILVNDGSKDGCDKIIDEYAQLDKRIVAVNKPNGGLSSARNEGIKVAKGEYIAFIDSDDYLDRTMIERLYALITTEKADMAACNFVSFIDGENAKKKEGIARNYTFNKNEAWNAMFKRDSIGWNAWNKLYRTSLFEDIRYPEGMICEDKATTYRLIGLCEKLVYTSEPLYYYRLRKTSITGQKSLKYYTDTAAINYEMRDYFDGLKETKFVRFVDAYIVKNAFQFCCLEYNRFKDTSFYSEQLSILKNNNKDIRYADYLKGYQKAIIEFSGKTVNTQKAKQPLLMMLSKILKP